MAEQIRPNIRIIEKEEQYTRRVIRVKVNTSGVAPVRAKLKVIFNDGNETIVEGRLGLAYGTYAYYYVYRQYYDVIKNRLNEIKDIVLLE